MKVSVSAVETHSSPMNKEIAVKFLIHLYKICERNL